MGSLKVDVYMSKCVCVHMCTSWYMCTSGAGPVHVSRASICKSILWLAESDGVRSKCNVTLLHHLLPGSLKSFVSSLNLVTSSIIQGSGEDSAKLHI